MEPTNLFYGLVEHFEGLRLKAYKDVAGIWTIAYGITRYDNGELVKEGDTCTASEAMQWLYDHVKGIQLPVLRTDGQYAACLDFCYNAGTNAFAISTLRKDILSEASADTITADFYMWDKAHVDGKLIEVDGLLRRRKCEAYLFNNGVNHPTFFL